MTDTFLNFVLTPHVEGHKTSIWNVMNKDMTFQLGRVAWYSQWRRYCFLAEPNTIYDTGCLNEISKFIETEMSKRKKT